MPTDDQRRVLYVKLTPEAMKQWRALADRHQASLTAIVEVLASHLADLEMAVEDLGATARALDHDRRGRSDPPEPLAPDRLDSHEKADPRRRSRPGPHRLR